MAGEVWRLEEEKGAGGLEGRWTTRGLFAEKTPLVTSAWLMLYCCVLDAKWEQEQEQLKVRVKVQEQVKAKEKKQEQVMAQEKEQVTEEEQEEIGLLSRHVWRVPRQCTAQQGCCLAPPPRKCAGSARWRQHSAHSTGSLLPPA